MNRAQRYAAQRERPIRTGECVRSTKLMNSQLIRSEFQKLDLTDFKFHIAFKKSKTLEAIPNSQQQNCNKREMLTERRNKKA
jgi:hypothetical protein